MIDIYLGDNLPILKELPAESVNLAYMDPPFNTGKEQRRDQKRATRASDGAHVGFGGRRYRMEPLGSHAFEDAFDDYLEFLGPRLVEAKRLLAKDGSLFVHLDYREVHYVKVFLDQLFGRQCFVNEIIWSYDYGARSKRRWSAKHDTILWYVQDPRHYTFNYDDIDRIPYLAPKLVGPEKAARGKTPTDVWWHTIVSPTGREKTGYPTQKPMGILRRLVRVHSRPGDTVLDCFAGSGTTGVAAHELGRHAILMDQSEEAVRIASERLQDACPTVHR